MILIATASFPQSSVKQAAQLYSKTKKLPSAIRLHGPYFKVEADRDISMIAVYESDSAAVNEVKKFIEKRFAAFDPVPGFTVTIEEWSTLADGVAKLAALPQSARK